MNAQQHSLARACLPQLPGQGAAAQFANGLGSASDGLVQRSMHMVMAVTQHSRLCEEDLVLRRSLLVRNPKVDALNFLQVHRLALPSC
jgi:phosphoenolpyruvate carboxylase